jgi:diguanylate cyclase (GGDEF)-like protein/PAS domain S-box-containing protein
MKSQHYRVAAKIAAIYASVAGLWIVFSDKILLLLVQDPAAITAMQTVKGWFFVLSTAAMLFWLVARDLETIGRSEETLRERNENLCQANEELTAAEEEARQQFQQICATQDKIRRQNECLQTLRETAFALMHARDVDALLRLIVEKAAAIGESSHAYLYTLTDDGRFMELKIVIGTVIREIGFRQQRGEGVVGKVWESGQPLVIHDYNRWPERLKADAFTVIRTSTGFPLIAGKQVVGVFGVNYFDHRELGENERDLLGSFAELASIALDNARLHRSLREELAERRKIEASLQRQQARTQGILDALPDLIIRVDRDGILREQKTGADMHTTVRFEENIGRHLREFTPPHIAEEIARCMRQAETTRATQYFEYAVTATDGTEYYREMRIVAVGDDEVIGIVRDITRRREMEQELGQMAFTDQATGLRNRAHFEAELRRLSDKRHLPAGVIVADIDGLKIINDTLGHETGDKLIVAAAGMIAACFGANDVVAHLGGGEFAVIMPGSDAAVVQAACERISRSIAGYREANQMPLSLSVGMSVRVDGDDTLNDTFKAADRNMYREKLHSKQSGHSAIVTTLAQALEARDFVTDGHADRLQDLMERLALAVGLPSSDLPDLRLFGRFHDIGKVGIPDHILFKPGRLSDEEYVIMKRHCEIGYRIALASPELAPIADWILKHQEWWNGGGYPLGLAGEDIPLPCRILAIVDAYDAMTNDRPYRPAMSCEEAVAELIRCAGHQFDAKLVELFVEIIRPH